MDPFRVICETCGARLKVSDERIIGEIHACPKCESMVHILPPDSGRTPLPVAVVAPEAVEPLAPEASVEFMAPAAVVDEAAPEPATATELVAPEPTAPEGVAAQAALAPAPVPAYASPIVLWGAGGALVLVGMSVGLWLGGAGGSDIPPAVPTVTANKIVEEPPEQEVVEQEPAQPPPVDAIVETSPPPVEPPGDDMFAPDPEVALAAQELPAESTVGQHPETAESAPRQVSLVEEPVPPQEDFAQAEPEKNQVAKGHRPVLRFDPLDFDPARLSLGSDVPTSDPATVESAAIESSDDVELERLPENPNDLLAPVVRNESLSVELGPIPLGSARSANADEQLGVQVHSFSLRNATLNHFVQSVSNIAGVPIGIDPGVLKLAGVSARTEVTVEAEDSTFKELLAEALSKRRLDLAERAGVAELVLANAGQWKTLNYEVKDLANGDDASTVADYITRFVSPDAWESSGGKGTIAVDGTTLRVAQSQIVHREGILFCERLRLARSRTPRSKYPAELLSIELPETAAGAALDAQTTFSFLRWSRLGDVIAFWQKASGLDMLVDWSALAEIELGPSSPVACSATERTWSEALDGILQPLGLAWWVVDGKTIGITSQEAMEPIRRVEFYPISSSLARQFASSDALVATLEKELRDRAQDAPAGETAAVVFDRRSNHVIVRAAPSAHRYLGKRLGDNAPQ